MNTSLPARVSVSDRVFLQEFDGAPILLNLGNSRYFEVDDVGARLWQLLAEDGDTGSACAQLVDEYDVTLEQLRKDLAILIKEWHAAGLVTIPSQEAQG